MCQCYRLEFQHWLNNTHPTFYQTVFIKIVKHKTFFLHWVCTYSLMIKRLLNFLLNLWLTFPRVVTFLWCVQNWFFYFWWLWLRLLQVMKIVCFSQKYISCVFIVNSCYFIRFLKVMFYKKFKSDSHSLKLWWGS